MILPVFPLISSIPWTSENTTWILKLMPLVLVASDDVPPLRDGGDYCGFALLAVEHIPGLIHKTRNRTRVAVIADLDQLLPLKVNRLEIRRTIPPNLKNLARLMGGTRPIHFHLKKSRTPRGFFKLFHFSPFFVSFKRTGVYRRESKLTKNLILAGPKKWCFATRVKLTDLGTNFYLEEGMVGWFLICKLKELNPKCGRYRL